MSTSSSPTASGSAPSSATLKKADQIGFNLFVKTAKCLVETRESEEKAGAKVDRWFNLETPDTLPPNFPLTLYRSLTLTNPPPPPLTIHALLLIPPLSATQLLVLHAPTPSPPVSPSGTTSFSPYRTHTHPSAQSTTPPAPQVLHPPPRAILLESWTLELLPLSASQLALPPPRDAGDDQEPLQRVYKRGIAFFRAVFQLLRSLPAYKLFRRLREAGGGGSRAGGEKGTMKGLRMVLRMAGEEKGVLDFESLATLLSPPPRTTTHRLAPVSTPHGALSLRADVLDAPLFMLASKEGLLSERFAAEDQQARRRQQRQGRGAYEVVDDEEEEEDEGLQFRPSLGHKFSTSPDSGARLAALAAGAGGSLRAAALHNNSSYNNNAFPPHLAPLQPSSPPARSYPYRPSPSSSPILPSSPSMLRDSTMSTPAPPRRDPTATGTSSQSGYFSLAALPTASDLPFASPSLSSSAGRLSSSPTPSLTTALSQTRERNASLRSTHSALSISDMEGVLPPAPPHPRRPSLNAPHPFKPSPAEKESLLAGSGGGRMSTSGSGSSLPPSPLHAYAPRPLTALSTSVQGGAGAVAFPRSSSSTLEESGEHPRPPLRTTRYSSSFGHRYGSGSAGSSGSNSLSGANSGIGEGGSGVGGGAIPIRGTRESTTAQRLSLSQSLSQSLSASKESVGASRPGSGSSSSAGGVPVSSTRRYSSSFGHRTSGGGGSGEGSREASFNGAPLIIGSLGRPSTLPTHVEVSPHPPNDSDTDADADAEPSDLDDFRAFLEGVSSARPSTFSAAAVPLPASPSPSSPTTSRFPHSRGLDASHSQSPSGSGSTLARERRPISSAAIDDQLAALSERFQASLGALGPQALDGGGEDVLGGFERDEGRGVNMAFPRGGRGGSGFTETQSPGSRGSRTRRTERTE